LHFQNSAVGRGKNGRQKPHCGIERNHFAAGAMTMSDLASRAKEIFLDAIENYEPEQWTSYLEEACAGDPLLRARVDKLLRARAQLGSFHEASNSLPEATTDEPLTERPGAVIGPYKLLQQIGEGGMGVVFMAEQEQPIRRRVALKIIKPGMDSAQVIARFEAERQALALMDHHNIAKVLDAGTTDSGRPYFVMELVHGVPITQYCDDHHLTPKERLELFVPVCHAVQHAHQKGIIHRDLKPSNVLVCLYDGVPVPKVIDFGVSKATGQSLTERTMFTQFGCLVGTLEYMSPEQAEMSQLGIDTRSDVYSMGVMLYELLTGTTPLERKRVKEAGFDEIRRLIREEEPPKPSTRLSASGMALAAISAQRQTEPAKLTRLVRGELDWIVMKALEKDRNRRYESANSLGRDVERYLHDEPVEACPPTTGYKLQKFARKHKAGLATAAGFVALLVLGVAGSTWQAVRATQAEAVAQANENKANAHAAEANQERDEAQRRRDEVQALNEKLQATQAQLKGTLYAAHMILAQQAWEENFIGRVRELLEQHRPEIGERDLRGFEWHYLDRLSNAELLTLVGHTGNIGSLAYSPDGKRLATSGGAWDNTRHAWVAGEIRMWNAKSGKELFALKGPTAGVNSVVFSPDSKRLATGGNDRIVRVWDAQTGEEIFTLKGHTGTVNYVTFSPDGKRLASASRDKTVKVWDAQASQELLTLKAHTDEVNSVVFSPDGELLASVSDDKTVKVWDALTGQELLTIKGHTGAVNRVAFNPNSKRLASAAADHLVKVWDAQTGMELLSLKGHAGVVNSVAFSPDGKRLGSASDDKTVKVWDAQTGQIIHAFKGHTDAINDVAFSPDGKRLASASADKTAKVWDVQAAPNPLTLARHAREVFGMAFSPDGKRLASTSPDKTVKVWNAQTGIELLTLRGHTDTVNYVAFSPDGKRLASASRDKTVKVWDAQTGQEILTFNGHTGIVWKAIFSPDGKCVASGSDDKTVKLWDSHTGKEFLTFKGHTGAVGGVAYSPDGKRLASAAGDKTVQVWDAQTGKVVLPPLQGHSGYGCVVFSPDGHWLASPVGRQVKVWNAHTGQELHSLQGHSRGAGSVVFSPDGKRLVGGGFEDSLVKVWDMQTGQEVLTIKGFHGVVFSPNGHWLAGGSDDGTLKIWDATPLPERPWPHVDRRGTAE
jgi:WD40 repeat protein/serine/threonine protein kinase